MVLKYAATKTNHGIFISCDWFYSCILMGLYKYFQRLIDLAIVTITAIAFTNY